MRSSIACLLVTVFVSVFGVAATGQESVMVEARNFAFSPRDAVVTVGTPVQWVNLDDAPHQIAMTGNQPGSSGLIEPGKAYAFTFLEPGQFTYRCGVHPTMLGVVLVKAP